VFQDQLTQAADRQAFADGLTKILTEQTQGISKSLEGIYPRPDPAATGIAEKMVEAGATLSVFKDFLGMFAEANAQVAPEGRLNQDQIDLLTRIAFPPIGERLHQLQHCIEGLSEKAATNELFVQLD
jgi:hypothetical protein